MKSKVTAKFLLPVVFAIWGLIGWKVYAAMKGKEPVVTEKDNAASKKKVAEEVPDSFVLQANYRDPFLGKAFVAKSPKPVSGNTKPVPEKKTEAPKPVATWPKIIYSGLVQRNGEQKKVGFLNVDGASHFVQGGEQIGEVKVLRLWKDSVEVVWGKEKRVVGK